MFWTEAGLEGRTSAGIFEIVKELEEPLPLSNS
jgi:hypothetical protein